MNNGTCCVNFTSFGFNSTKNEIKCCYHQQIRLKTEATRALYEPFECFLMAKWTIFFLYFMLNVVVIWKKAQRKSYAVNREVRSAKCEVRCMVCGMRASWNWKGQTNRMINAKATIGNDFIHFNHTTHAIRHSIALRIHIRVFSAWNDVVRASYIKYYYFVQMFFLRIVSICPKYSNLQLQRN